MVRVAKIVIFACLAFALAEPCSAAQRTVHLVAFGDSSTAGYLVTSSDAYPAQLQSVLRGKGYKVAIKNAGISGDTTEGGLRRFASAIGRQTEVVIVEFGTNDLHLGGPAEKMRANLDEIVRKLRRRSIEVLIIGFGAPLDFSDIARARGALYTQWKLPPGQYRASDGVHYSAEGYGILVAQMLPSVEALLGRVAKR
jgi:acyl-CoA thioesterase-1